MKISVAYNIKINKLKKKIRRKYISKEYTHSYLILFFNKNELSNKDMLNTHHNVKNGDTLTWYWRIKTKNITLHIKQLHSDNKFYLNKFKMKTEIQHLRDMIHFRNEHLNIPIHAFKLFYNGLELIDYSSLIDYGVSDDITDITIVWFIDHSLMSQQFDYNQTISYEQHTTKYEPITNNNNMYYLKNGCTYYGQTDDHMRQDICWDYLSEKGCPRKDDCRWQHSNIDPVTLTDIDQKHVINADLQDQETGNKTITNQNEAINTNNDMIRITIQSKDATSLFSCFTCEFIRNAMVKSVEDKITDIDTTLIKSTKKIFVSFKGVELSKEKTFEYYGIDNDDILVWYLQRDKKDEIDIQISDVYGNTIMLEVDPTININALKDILSIDYPTWYIKNMEHGWFRFRGKRLSTTWTLLQCGISNGDKLEWLCQYN
eukprot:498165_1